MVYISPTHPHLPSPSLTRIHANLHTCTHAHTHAHTHTHTHTCTHTHRYIHRAKRSFQGRAVAISQVSPVSTGPLFASLVACFLSPHLQRVWLVRLVNDQKDETSVVRQKGWILIRVKLSSGLREASFWPKNDLMIRSNHSEPKNFRRNMPPDSASCCVFMHIT